MIADAIEQVGNDGALCVQDGPHHAASSSSSATALRFDRGFSRQDMATDEARKEAVLDYPFVLLADEKLASGERLGPILEQVAQTGRPLLVIAEMIEGDALQHARHEQGARHPHRRSRSWRRSSASGARGCSRTSP